MLLMTKQINDTNFGGRQMVTCYSCHHGMARPRITPSLAASYAPPPDDRLDGRSVFQLTEVQPIVNVPPDRFARPEHR